MAGNDLAQNGSAKGDLVLVTALAGGASVRQAAAKAGIGQRTAYRRWSDPDFRQRVTEVRAEMFEQAVGMLAGAACEGVETLRELLSSKSDSVRLGAARSILELGSRLREVVELEQRLSQELLENPALEMSELEEEENDDSAVAVAESEDGPGDPQDSSEVLEQTAEESLITVDQNDYSWEDAYDERAPRARASGGDDEDDKHAALYNTPGRPAQRDAAWRPVSRPSPAASTPTMRTSGSSMNG